MAKKILTLVMCLGAGGLLVFCLATVKPDLFGISGSTWPTLLRDPGRTGFSEVHSPGESRVAWTYTLPQVGNQKGVILGSPAVSNDKVFFGALDGKVHALDLKTGAELWTFTGQKSFWASSPAVHNGIVFIGSQDKYVYAIDLETGEQIWRYLTGGAISSSSPVVYKDKVYIGSEDGFLYALNETTGALVWKESLGEKIYSSPAAYKDKIYVGVDSPNNGTYELHCLSAANGEGLWEVEAESGNKFTASPSVFANLVYIGGLDSKVYAFEYASGDEFWSKNTNHEITSTPAIAYDRIYVTNWDGQLLSLEKNTGHVYWRYRAGSRVEGSPIVAEKKICFGAKNGYFYCIDRGGGLIWKKQVEGEITTAAAASTGMIIVVSHTDTGSTITAFGRYYPE